MNTQLIYRLAADAILVLHVLFVAFVIIGLVFIFLGKARGWDWVRNPWFRLAHLAAIGVVTLQSWLGVDCFLTSWEMELRSYAGDAVYTGSFISHALESLLYYRAPPWVFVVGYTTFGIIVVASWIWVPPGPFTTPSNTDVD